MREQKWNDHWQFCEGPVNISASWETGKSIREVTLPHDAMLEHPANPESRNGSAAGYRDGADYNYTKKFFVAEEQRNETISLRFEGVYMNASVFVNGSFAGKCHYGYNTFTIPLDRFLRYGMENEVRVTAVNSGMPNSRWYSGGGIYRDVYLLRGRLIYIEPDSLKVKTLEADEDFARIEVSLTVSGRTARTEDLRAKLRIIGADGETAVKEEISFVLYEGTKKTLHSTLLIQKPALWSAESPSLYKACVSLSYADGTAVPGPCTDTSADASAQMCGNDAEALPGDAVTFGIRTIAVDPVRGLRINGKTVKLRGACIHHDNGILGAASYEDAAYRRMMKLKEAGFNAVRMSHHPMGQAELRACDRAGLYVMDETFDMWNTAKNDSDYSLFFDEDWKVTLDALAGKDFNHPCVVMYSLGNEIPESGDDHAIELMMEMSAYLRKKDPTRFITQAVNGAYTAGEHMAEILQDVMNDLNAREGCEEINSFMTVLQDHLPEIMEHRVISERLKRLSAGLDLVGYNYMPSRYLLDAIDTPNRVTFGSETYPPAITREWDIIESCPSCIGEFTWTGWDYLGETGIGITEYEPCENQASSKYPNQLAYVGDLDITGYRRPMSYLREIVYNKSDKPYIALQDPHHFGEAQAKGPWRLSDAVRSFDFPDCEGKPVVVEVYSAADEVELFINGSSCGRKAAGRKNGYRVLFETVFQTGCAEAVAYRGGEECGRDLLESAGNGRHLVIRRETEYPMEELVYLEICVRDEEGRLAADCRDEISIEAEGAELLGFGSADFAPVHNYNETVTRLFGGRAQAILRKPQRAGKQDDPGCVTVTVSRAAEAEQVRFTF